MKEINIWTEDEINFLVGNYPIHGINYCLSRLSYRSKTSVKSKIQKLKLKKVGDSKYEYENFKTTIENSKNKRDVCKNLGLGLTYGNRKTIQKYIDLYGLDTSHFKTTKSEISNRKELSEILIEDSTYNNTTNLKKRLYKEGLKKPKCELCGQGEKWMGKHMSLILDHINGVNNDNRIENLRIVCPNCNATLDTHGGKNIKNKKDKIEYFCICGNSKSKSSKKCKACYVNDSRKVDRPPYEELILLINELGYVGTGKKYGVSDNSIRKWVKYYEKHS